MKKNFNVIQIKGTRGLIMAAFVVTCLAAGFIVFPGWLCMHLWNYASNYSAMVPNIGLIQGVLLWGILAAAYFTFRKDKVVVCMKSPQGLSEEELKEVFADIKKQSENDPILKAMMKAREAELKMQSDNNQNENVENKEIISTSESNKV